MDFNKLCQTVNCLCGRTHSCGIKHIVIAEGAIAELGQFTTPYNLFGIQKPFLFCCQAALPLLCRKQNMYYCQQQVK